MFDMPRRLIVIGDAHGDIARMISALQAAKVLNEALEWVAQPANTYVVQMGDQIDGKNRGDVAAWETVPDIAFLEFMDHIDFLARSHGGRVFSLIGNHELMNIVGDFSYVSQESLASTGGEIERALRFSVGGQYANILSRRYIVLKLGRYLFCHAGLLPIHLNIVGENIQDINHVFWKMMSTGKLNTEREKTILSTVIASNDGVLWTRRYADIAASDNKEALDDTLYIVLKTTKTTTMFIGHNTVPSTTIVARGSLIFTDAMFSRAYGSQKFQFIEVLDDMLRIVEVV